MKINKISDIKGKLFTIRVTKNLVEYICDTLLENYVSKSGKVIAAVTHLKNGKVICKEYYTKGINTNFTYKGKLYSASIQYHEDNLEMPKTMILKNERGSINNHLVMSTIVPSVVSKVIPAVRKYDINGNLLRCYYYVDGLLENCIINGKLISSKIILYPNGRIWQIQHHTRGILNDCVYNTIKIPAKTIFHKDGHEYVNIWIDYNKITKTEIHEIYP